MVGLGPTLLFFQIFLSVCYKNKRLKKLEPEGTRGDHVSRVCALPAMCPASLSAPAWGSQVGGCKQHPAEQLLGNWKPDSDPRPGSHPLEPAQRWTKQEYSGFTCGGRSVVSPS